jgi:leader peptidase (prepilin peptidase)/N-methyltransferase
VAVVLSALAGRSAGWTALLPAYVLLALCCAPLAVIDVEHHRLPNRLVFLAAGGALVLLTAAAAQRHDWHAWLRGAEAAGVVFALFYAIALLATFGWGDVKLGGLLAGYLGLFGWGYVLYGILAGFVLAAAFSLPMVLVRRVSMKTAIPLGPSLIVGALLVTAFRLVPATLA